MGICVTDGMRHQRCIWHGQRDLSFMFYKDGFRGFENRNLVDLLGEIPVFRLKAQEGPEIREKVEEILKGSHRLWEELLEVFDREAYPRAHSYLKRLGENLFALFRAMARRGFGVESWEAWENKLLDGSSRGCYFLSLTGKCGLWFGSIAGI